MVKIKWIIAVPVLLIVAIGIISYFLFMPGEIFRNDCGTPLTAHDVLFVYLTGCSHCKNDFLRIQQLNLTDRFYMIDAGSSKCQQVINDYSSYIIYHNNSNVPSSSPGIATPTKVCLYNNKTYVGEQTGTDLLKFYQDCVAAKG